MFLKNTWYVACTPNEVDEKPLGRTICNERIAFFRAAQGKVAAAEDFCPHRGAALSLGRVNDGKLVCGYHAPAEQKAYSVVADFITPETDTSIWYFWGMARKFKPDDKALTAAIRDGQHKIFSEDLEVLEHQQRNLLTYPERGMLKLNIDAGGVQSRKVIERLLAKERTSAAGRAAHRS